MSNDETFTWGLVRLFVMEYATRFNTGVLTLDKIHDAVDRITVILQELITNK